MKADKAKIPAFVKSDIDLMRFLRRIEKRTERYPNWRQVYSDCLGMCNYPINENGDICGEIDTLEFHEIYEDCATPEQKELGAEDYKLYQTVLVCNYHHFSIHNGICNPRHYPSMLQLDIAIELKLAGGLENWEKKYNIITNRRVEYDFTMDNGKHTDDVQSGENSEDNGGE